MCEGKQVADTITTRPTQAEIHCQRQGFGFPQAFAGQFQLSRNPELGTEGFRKLPLGDWFLHCHHLARVSTLCDASGQVVGCCIGLAVDRDGHLIEDGYRFDALLGSAEFSDTVERHVTWFGGRYVVMITGGSRPTVYGDPACALGVVFDPETQLVASSLLLCLYRNIDPNPLFDNEAIWAGKSDPHAREVFRPIGSYGFGHTYDRTVRRLRPNHALSLSDFRETRFWPRQDVDFAKGDADLRDVAERITRRLRQITTAVMSAAPSWFALSGGYDSRMLLAASREGFPENATLYSHALNWSTKLDMELAEKLAVICNLPFRRIIPEGDNEKGALIRPRRQNRIADRHVLATGYVSVLDDHTRRGAMDWIPDGNILVRGNMLELVTAVWWPDPGVADPLSLNHVLKRFRVSYSNSDQLAHRNACVQEWHDTLPDGAKARVHDFSYIENSLGSLQCNFTSLGRIHYVPPACDREVFRACMSVDPGIRKRGKLYRPIMESSGPDLLEIPTLREAKIAARRG